MTKHSIADQIDDDQLLTIKDVARRLQLSERTVRRLLDAGELSAFRVRRQWRIAEEDLQKYLKECRPC